MAKLLLVGDTTAIKDSNFNDIIAVYEDNQELGKKEQELVNSGRFKLVQIADTIEDVQDAINAAHPEIKECWYDKTDETWKDLKKRPRFSMQYNAGVIAHNFKLDAVNDKAVNGDKITKVK